MVIIFQNSLSKISTSSCQILVRVWKYGQSENDTIFESIGQISVDENSKNPNWLVVNLTSQHLVPYEKYSTQAKLLCGTTTQEMCPMKTRHSQPVHFETLQSSDLFFGIELNLL